jgi:hypothetical protein
MFTLTFSVFWAMKMTSSAHPEENRLASDGSKPPTISSGARSPWATDDGAHAFDRRPSSVSDSDHASSLPVLGPGDLLARHPTGRVGRRVAAGSRNIERQASTPALTQTA